MQQFCGEKEAEDVDETKKLLFPPYLVKLCDIEPPLNMRRVLHTEYRVSSWRGEKNWRRRLKTLNFIEAVLARDEM
ncbi:hypothetical protein E2C01_077198 [Portunus trituberculatus]|uniref:Uncharacterized protein n=1 Tax=Portunus trituberculatus TaxID=210409 RepID=A0A5B7IL77_PORTR|nr:hypothetical protein [Portunus trituberculatus]